MEVQFNDQSYDRLETVSGYTFGLPAAVVTGYRMCLQLFRAAADVRDLRALRQLNLDSISEDTLAFHSVPLGDGYELILQLRSGTTASKIQIIAVTKATPTESAK